ncbi:MAG: restriction endonuclease [Longimicrobiales bacterium]
MTDPAALTQDGCEILIARELRRAGIQPVTLRRVNGRRAGGGGWCFDLVGRLEAYGQRWTVLIECRNDTSRVCAADVDELRRRADAATARSALIFATSVFEPDAVARAEELRVALLHIVDAHPALLAAGLIQPGPLPAWVPELTVELVTLAGHEQQRRLLPADQPESILEQLRRCM